MESAVDNPIEGDMFSNLHADTEAQTTTTARHNPKQAVVRKCLHPPSAVPEFCGLPTNDARSQVHLEWRNMQLMQTPYIIDSAPDSPTYSKVRACTPADLATFDYAFLIPNGARVKSIGFVYNATTGRMEQDYNGKHIEQLYDFAQWSKDVNLYRPTYKSTTLYLNATAFNNTGMVVGNQFNPNILFAGTLLGMSHEQPSLFHSLVTAGVTSGKFKHLQRPTREQVELWETFPHYHRAEVLRRTNANPTDIINLDPNTTHQIISFGRLSSDAGVQNVPSSSQILGNSLRSLGCKAMEGVFSVQRLNTITPSWCSGATTRSPTATEIGGLYQCWYAEVDGTTGVTLLQAFNENAPIGTANDATVALNDTLWSKDMTWSWVRFSGLSLNSQTSTSMQLLIKKTYCGYEVQPCLASAWSGMMQLGPKPDLTALQAMMDGFYELKDVMPARYNFWGTIAGLAAKGLKTFGTGVLTNLTKHISDSITGAGKKSTAKQPAKKKKAAATNRLDADVKQLTAEVQRMGVGRGQQQRRRGNNRNPRRVNPPPPPPSPRQHRSKSRTPRAPSKNTRQA